MKLRQIKTKIKEIYQVYKKASKTAYICYVELNELGWKYHKCITKMPRILRHLAALIYALARALQ